MAWQHGASTATVSAWFMLMSSANISKFSLSAPKFEKIYFSRNKLPREVHAGMTIVSGGKRRDYEQVTLPEYVRVSIMLLLVFAPHIGIELF